MGAAVVTLWPLLVPSAWSKIKEEKRRSENSIFGLLNALADQGTDKDELPNGIGEFGLVVTNPIPTRIILGSTRYLANLYTADGEKTTHTRVGSTRDAVSENPIDIYEVRSQATDFHARLYISPYHKKNSSNAPRGFRIGPAPSAPIAPLGVTQGGRDTVDKPSASPDGETDVSVNSQVEENQVSLAAMSDDDVLECARTGVIEAQFEIGIRKLSSGGNSEEKAAGLRWLERAANRHHLEAQLALAHLLIDGEVVAQNIAEGLRWAREAAEQGSNEATALVALAEKVATSTAKVQSTSTKKAEEPLEGVRPQRTKPVAQSATRTTGFGFNQGGRPRSEIDFKLLRRGVQRGLQCRNLAISKLKDGQFAQRASSLSEANLEDLAQTIASRRGYFTIGSDRGMEGLVDGAEGDFDQLRSCFILGVREGLSGVTPEECAEYYSHSVKR